MILVDTSIWIGHFRATDPDLVALLEAGQVLSHPFVTGELAMGNLKDRSVIIEAMNQMPAAIAASDAEVIGYIERHGLHGLGIGYVDAHLLASVSLTPDARHWTGDLRLARVAGRLGLAR